MGDAAAVKASLMADNGFNGTTATFASAELGDGTIGCRYNETAAKVQVSASGDTQHTYEAGLDDVEVVIDFVGIAAISVGDKGAIAVTWNDGSSESITNAVCTALNYGGNLDGNLSGSATFCPSTAAPTT